MGPDSVTFGVKPLRMALDDGSAPANTCLWYKVSFVFYVPVFHMFPFFTCSINRYVASAMALAANRSNTGGLP